jgi:hypothetical protein
MPALLDAPFWLDPSDPHQMASVMQVSSRPLARNYDAAAGTWRLEYVWAKAIHRIVTEGISSHPRAAVLPPRGLAAVLPPRGLDVGLDVRREGDGAALVCAEEAGGDGP